MFTSPPAHLPATRAFAARPSEQLPTGQLPAFQMGLGSLASSSLHAHTLPPPPIIVTFLGFPSGRRPGPFLSSPVSPGWIRTQVTLSLVPCGGGTSPTPESPRAFSAPLLSLPALLSVSCCCCVLVPPGIWWNSRCLPWHPGLAGSVLGT